MARKVMIQVDDAGFVYVDTEKEVLVVEVIKHFTPKWQEKAGTDQQNGKIPNSLAYVHGMLDRMAVEHDVLPMPKMSVHILGPNTPALDEEEPIPPESEEDEDPGFPDDMPGYVQGYCAEPPDGGADC